MVDNLNRAAYEQYVSTSDQHKASQDNSSGIAHGLEEFARSAAYSAVQSPLKGGAQFLDHLAGTDLAKHVNLIDAPKAAAFGSMDWHIQQIGGAVGMAAPFFLMNKGVGKLMGAGTATAETLGLSSLGRPMLQAGITGALYDGVLRESDNKDFWSGRLKNSVTGAATFSTLAGTAQALRFTGLTNAAELGVISGVPAGLVNAEFDARLNHGRDATRQELTQGAYGMAMVGGMLGAFDIGWNKKFGAERTANTDATKLNTDQLANQPRAREFEVVGGRDALQSFRLGKQPTAWMQVRELFADGAKGPQRSLIAQHNDGAVELAANTTSADLAAHCNPETTPDLASKHVLPGAAGTVWAETNGDASRVRFSAGERPSPEAFALGKNVDGGMDGRAVLRNNGLEDLLPAIPKQYLKLPLTGEVWQGDASYAFPLAERDGFPPAVLKITTRDWENDWGRRPGDAAILKLNGDVDSQARVHEGETEAGMPAYTYLQELVDTSPAALVDGGKYDALLEQNGLALTDVGSGAQKGRSYITNDVRTLDYQSVTPQGSMENRTLQEIANGGEWIDEQESKATKEEDTPYSGADGYSDLDMGLEAKRQAFLERPKLSAAEKAVAKQLFGDNSDQQTAFIMQQLLDGMTTRKEIIQLQTYMLPEPDAKVAKQQVDFVASIAERNGLQPPKK